MLVVIVVLDFPLGFLFHGKAGNVGAAHLVDTITTSGGNSGTLENISLRRFVGYCSECNHQFCNPILEALKSKG